jgi:hypothetical protein
MPDDHLRERLKRDLERPRLVSSSPAQARYRQAPPVGAVQVGFRLGGAFAAGAVAAALLLTVGTGSPNPQVWTVRVSSALTRIGEPAPVGTPISTPPAASPTQAPTGNPSSRPLVVGGTPEARESPEARPGTPEPTESPERSPEPSPAASAPAEDGGGGDHGGGGDGDLAAPSPAPSPSPDR